MCFPPNLLRSVALPLLGLSQLLWKEHIANTHTWYLRNFQLTRRPRIWFMAADSFRVHSSITFCLISFIKSMKALSGFFIRGFLVSGTDEGDGTPFELLSEGWWVKYGCCLQGRNENNDYNIVQVWKLRPCTRHTRLDMAILTFINDIRWKPEGLPWLQSTFKDVLMRMIIMNYTQIL